MGCPGNRRRNAFTLVEVLAASVVLLLGVLAVVSALSSANALSTLTREQTIAQLACQEQMELIRGMPFVSVVSGFFPSAAFVVPGFDELTAPVGIVTVDYPFGAAAPQNRIIRVVVTVTWQSAGSRQLRRSVVTYMTEGGLNG